MRHKNRLELGAGNSNFSLSVNRPSLRHLGSTSASTNSALLLLDGHRLPSMGITRSSADLDSISPSDRARGHRHRWRRRARQPHAEPRAGQDHGIWGSFTLGRLVRLGISKKF